MPNKPAKRESEASLLMWDQLVEIAAPKLWSVAKEYQFAKPRKWRFDFILWNDCPERAFCIEIEGGAFIQGRHTRGVGFIKDMEKYNHAAMLGWKVLRFTPSQVLRGEAIAFIKRVLELESR